MSQLHTFTFNAFCEQTYLFDHGDGKATVFDPGMSDAAECEIFEKACEDLGVVPVQCWLTHAHLDHILGTGWIYKRYGILPRLYPADSETWQQAPRVAEIYGVTMNPLPELGDPLGPHGHKEHCGPFVFELRFAPGHCIGHVIFVCHELRMVVGGDVLFKASVGRIDLPGGDAPILAASIADQLFSLPDDFEVWPGHGPSTTIGWEKQNNPFVNELGTGMMQR